MRPEEVDEALAFLYWSRDRIVAAAAGLTDAAFCSDTPVATRSLRGTLVHQVECEWAWRIRLLGGAFPDGDVLPGEFASLQALMERWRNEERELRAWVAGLGEADLAAQPPGQGNPLAMWRYLLYVVNHGLQQFAEAAVLLSQLGHSPGEIGYLEFCNERAGGGGGASAFRGERGFGRVAQ